MKKLLLSILIILLLSSVLLISCGEVATTTTADVTTTTTEKVNTVPTFQIENPEGLKTSLEFEVTENDPDNVGAITKIELYKDGVRVKTAENTDIRKFSNLTSSTKYTVKVTYSYDLQNGEGEKTEVASVDITTTDGFSSKTTVKRDWAGKTLNIACSTWSAEPKAPWSVIELCVDYGKESGFGTKIDASVLERQKFIKETYGVELNFINATRYGMHDALKTAELAGNINYDLALPRAMRAQSIVSNGSVYDLKDREYLDFDNSYYNQASVEAYTAKGHTFFVDGDFSTINKETAKVLFFNKTLLGGEQATADLYRKVREGKWTWSELVTLATAAYKDDGDGVRGDNDIYGLSQTSINDFYYYFGVKQAGTDQTTGKWKITLNDGRSDDIITAIIHAKTSNWCRTGWEGIYPDTPFTYLKQDRLLFYSSCFQESFYALNYDNAGVVPFPMLNEEQGGYCVPLYGNEILVCIPKITQDRQMSEYFLDVLTWTGNDYVTNAYFEQKAEHLGNDEDMEMLKSYIFPNIVYDAGKHVNWDSLIGVVYAESYRGNVNRFDEAYAKCEPEALKTVAKWNEAWGAYTEN